MINESQLNTMYQSIQARHNEIEQVKLRMENALANLKTEGRTPEYLEKQRAEILARHLPVIDNALAKISEANAVLQKAERFYQSTEFFLSTQPLTTGHDQNAESVARMSRSLELSRMSPAMLALHAEKAKATGAWGDLGMIVTENSSRGKDAAQIPLDDCPIPGRESSLKAIRQANGLAMTADIVRREVMGMPVSPVDRITAARLAGGSKA